GSGTRFPAGASKKPVGARARDCPGPKLANQEFGQDETRRVEQASMDFSGLGEGPAPALAVVPGLLKAFRYAVIDWCPIGFDGRSSDLAGGENGISQLLLIVGQDAERRETLEAPRAGGLPALHERRRERQDVSAGRAAVAVGPRAR